MRREQSRSLRGNWYSIPQRFLLIVLAGMLCTFAAGVAVGGLYFSNQEGTTGLESETLVTHPGQPSTSPTTAMSDASVPTSTETLVEAGPMTIHVSPAGNDLGSGTIDDPVRTGNRAIEISEKGSTIVLAPGMYEPIMFEAQSDLVLTGAPGQSPESFIIQAGDYTQEAGISISASDHIQIVGIRVQHSLWGIQVIASSDILLDGNQVTDIGQEAVHVREFSQDIVISNNTIWSTGRRESGPLSPFEYRKRGEGIYIGTGSKSGDETRGILIVGNHIHHTTGEAIDVKPAVTDVRIVANAIHDIETHASGAVVVWVGRREHPAPRIMIEANVIYNIGEVTGHTDGNAIRLSGQTTVQGNLIWGTSHHGVLADGDFTSPNSNVVEINNNIIFENGRDPIKIWDTPNPATATVSDNSSSLSFGASVGGNIVGNNGWPTSLAWQALFDHASIDHPDEFLNR